MSFFNNPAYLLLDPSQQKALDILLGKNQNVLVKAKAGFGKTQTLLAAISIAESLDYQVLICASSGKAAAAIGGITAHKSTGMLTGHTSTLPKEVAGERQPWGDRYSCKYRQPFAKAVSNASKLWQAPKLLVILDEVFQLCAEDLLLWWEIGLAKRRLSKQKNLPAPLLFLSGDAGQFLPIQGNPIFRDAVYSYWEQANRQAQIVKPSPLISLNLSVIELEINHRQKDPIDRKALDWLYYGIDIHYRILDRLVEPPSTPASYYFNNALVERLNLEEAQALKSQGANSRTYHACGDDLPDDLLRTLLPVQSQTTVYEGGYFTLVLNLDLNRDTLTNGEVVKVLQLKPQSIIVRTTKGINVELGLIKHYLPLDPVTKKARCWLQLPGYFGSNCSLMKTQGLTLSTPSLFACWQTAKNGFRSLGDRVGALYTICSRVTDLNLLYFDLSLGYDPSYQLLQSSLNVPPYVLDFLLDNRRPWWRSSRGYYVIALIGINTRYQSPELTILDFEVDKLQTRSSYLFSMAFSVTGSYIRSDCELSHIDRDNALEIADDYFAGRLAKFIQEIG